MTTHWTAWKEAVKDFASVGRATLAMLVSREESNMESERLASAHRGEGVPCALPSAGSSRPVLFGSNMPPFPGDSRSRSDTDKV